MQILKKTQEGFKSYKKHQQKYHDNIFMSKINTIKGKKRDQSGGMSLQLLEPHQICFL